jgi:hypothetical protein
MYMANVWWQELEYIYIYITASMGTTSMAALKVLLGRSPFNLVAQAGVRVLEYILRDAGLWSGRLYPRSSFN